MHKRIKERGWEMAARAGLRASGMGSAIPGRTSLLSKKEVYSDVSGHVHGAWSLVENSMLEKAVPRVSLSSWVRPTVSYEHPEPEKVQYNSSDWGRNIVAKNGTVKIRLNEAGDPLSVKSLKLRDVTATIDIEGGDLDWQIEVHGQHVVDTGAIIMASNSYKYVI
jgi:hypothetical protein